MYYSAAVGIAMWWTDARLGDTPCVPGSIVDRAYVDRIWKPDFYVYSSVKVDLIRAYEDVAHLKYLGKSKFLWYPKMNVKVKQNDGNLLRTS